MSPGPELMCIETFQAFIFWCMGDHNTTPAALWGHIWLGERMCEGATGLSSPESSSWHVRQLLAAPLVHGLYTGELAG